MPGIVAILALTVVFALVNWRLSMARLRKMLEEKGAPLHDEGLEALIAKLGAVVDLPQLKANVFDMDVVNGLATPDGRIFISSALLQKYRMGIIKGEEVASVIAHELGHVALGHHSRRLVDWTGRNAVAMVLGAMLNRFIPVIGFYIAQFLASLATARLSRRDEFEADRYATALMIRAGLGHGPQVSMFRKLERMNPGPRPAAWLASHPPVPDRIAAIEGNVAAWTRG
jgi:putative metalloprotease